MWPAWNTPLPVTQVPLTRSPMALYSGKALEQNVLTIFTLLTLKFCSDMCQCQIDRKGHIYLDICIPYIGICCHNACLGAPSKARQASELLDTVILLFEVCTLLSVHTIKNRGLTWFHLFLMVLAVFGIPPNHFSLPLSFSSHLVQASILRLLSPQCFPSRFTSASVSRSMALSL